VAGRKDKLSAINCVAHVHIIQDVPSYVCFSV